MTILKNKSTEENSAYWAHVEAVAAKVTRERDFPTNKWFPVEPGCQAPEVDEEVLIASSHGFTFQAVYLGDGKWEDSSTGEAPEFVVAYWFRPTEPPNAHRAYEGN